MPETKCYISFEKTNCKVSKANVIYWFFIFYNTSDIIYQICWVKKITILACVSGKQNCFICFPWFQHFNYQVSSWQAIWPTILCFMYIKVSNTPEFRTAKVYSERGANLFIKNVPKTKDPRMWIWTILMI